MQYPMGGKETSLRRSNSSVRVFPLVCRTYAYPFLLDATTGFILSLKGNLAGRCLRSKKIGLLSCGAWVITLRSRMGLRLHGAWSWTTLGRPSPRHRRCVAPTLCVGEG